MKTLYLVDYENSCQNFLKFSCGDTNRYDFNRTFEIVVFVAKSTNLDHLDLIEKGFVTVNRALTDGNEAADISLHFYAQEKFLLGHSSYGHYHYDKIYIVKGNEKGYEELMARLKVQNASKFDFLNFDAAKTFCDYVPSNNSCLLCQLVFANEYTASRHKIATNCTECLQPLICEQGRKAHELVRNPICGNWWCYFRYPKCCPNKCEVHLKSHPLCDCGCEERYFSAEDMRRHLDSLKVHSCGGCTERFRTTEDLYAHAAAQDHFMTCTLCSARNIKNMPKHLKKCHS
jgi:hypothetical protein